MAQLLAERPHVAATLGGGCGSIRAGVPVGAMADSGREGATAGALLKTDSATSVAPVFRDRMSQLHDLRLRLLVQQESERIADSQLEELDLSVVQARCLCWLALLAEAHEDQASDAERQGEVEQAMGWFADSMRLRDVIHVVSSIEIPLPAALDKDEPGGDQLGGDPSRQGPWAA